MILIVLAFVVGTFVGQNFEGFTKLKEIKNDAQAYYFLKSNNIQLWGIESCSWCEKQRDEFGTWFSLMLEHDIYVNCQENQSIMEECIAYDSGTPFWVKDNEVIHSGYIPVDQVKKVLGEKI